jgi:hypothetical protein
MINPARPRKKNATPVLSTRSAIDLGGLYVAGWVLAKVYPAFGSFASDIFAGLGPFLTLAFIGATAWFTQTLSDSTNQIRDGADATLAHLETSSRREQRGYVFFSEKGWKRQDAYFALRFKNFGHTPVKDVEVIGYIAAAKRNHVGPLPRSPRATDTFRTMLGPQVALDADFMMRLPDKLATKILQKKLIAYFHGKVKYTDVFKVRRWTKFRYCLIGDVLHNCAEGNDWY